MLSQQEKHLAFATSFPMLLNILVIDPAFYRPSEVEYLCGLPDKAEEKLGWKPEIPFVDLVQRMVESDINAKKEEIFSKELEQL